MSISFDLKYGWRLLYKTWGYSLMYVTVIALSVGLAVWMSSVTYSELLKPLGFPDSDRWYSVQIASKAAADALPSVDAYTYQELLQHNHAADYLGAFANRKVVLSEGQASTGLRAGAFSPRLLAATQVPPLMGRLFQEGDGQTGAPPVAILSFDTWQNYFAADVAIVGKTARIDSAPVEIIAVMPKGFYAFQDFELWQPLQIPTLARPNDSTLIVAPLVALKPGQNVNDVLNEIKPTIDSVNGSYPSVFNSERQVQLFPAHRMFTHGVAPVLAMVNLLVVAVIVLGCVNISMVFLARLLERSRELALRSALGASRSRLLCQCLLETAVVLPLGLLAGYALAAILIGWLQGIESYTAQIFAEGRSGNVPALQPIHLLVGILAVLAIWLVSTLLPAWRITKQDPATVLAGSGKGSTVSGGNKGVGIIVGLQVVVSSLVLVTCVSVVLAVNKEAGKPTGLKSSHVVISTYPTVFSARYSEPPQRLRYWESLRDEIQSRIPGAEVAFASAIPTRPPSVAALIETQQGTANQGTLTLPSSVVSEAYFKLLGLSLRSGRLFESTDSSDSLKVAVVDEQMAARYWPDQEVLGKRVQLNPSDGGTWLTIVGVVSGVAAEPYRPDTGVVYRPLRQVAPSEFQLLVKLQNPGSESRSNLRAAAFAIDRDLPLHNLQSLDDYLAAQDLRFPTLESVVIVAAIITVILAASGLFGLISRSVMQRTQEVGIRRALGATAWQATTMFLRQGAIYLGVAVAGVLMGLGIMPLLSVVMPNILDRAILVSLGVVLLMATVILISSYLPSRRAVALEPGDALRYE